MEKKTNSYGQILKSTSLFGGVQVFNILLSAIKTKVVTVLIGANGFGVLSLFSSTVNLIVDLTKLGLDTSAVREISQYNSKKNKTEVVVFINVLNKVIWITGIIGAVLTLLFSKKLSIWTFGNSDYTIEFLWLSIAILINQLSHGKKAILQGTQQLGKLAKANLLASTIGLIVSVPLYYFYNIRGIVPSIILSFVLTYMVFSFYSKSNAYKSIKMRFSKVMHRSKTMLSLGATMSFTSLFMTLILWLIQIYIRNYSGVESVGFYNAGIIIINSYLGIVFNAMGTDYFPRLSAINKNNSLIKDVVNEQAEVAILLITPLIVLFIAFSPFIIKLLYTKQFIIITGLVVFGVLGALFKAVSFSLGYVIIAKGDSKIFIKTSIFFNILMFSICILSYTLGGLTGLGLGLLVYYIIHFVLLKIITVYLYGITLKMVFYKKFLICIIFCVLSYLGTLIAYNAIRFFVIIFIFLCSIVFVFSEFKKVINIEVVIKKLFKIKNKKSED
ncbi:oligosaccharide flippase family protein [Aestuariivivens insulae]|uniref:oligosaccharide flippase family protein n=1 Tax=Aestuariivivens insulae TaxID=1621988 RepID=UPI001F585608|nr:oligosaccharide flippase family protein [Aestuariivivens insulae]